MKYFYTFAIPVLLLCAACSDWLDVTPRVQVKETENFTTAQGFKDALTGVYMLMTEESCYGRELSFGLTDVLGKQYTTSFGTASEYYYPSIYDYTATASKTKFATIWRGMYTAIANVNNLIAYVDQADTMLFAPDEYHVIRGEAYGLRAFLHFDLARLFAPAFIVSPDAKAIPYITSFSNQTTPLVSIRQVIDNALADLSVAERELKHDPVTRGISSSDYSDYLRNRHYHFNYYAVKLLQARIYLYKGEHRPALAAAGEVIAQSLFTWTPEAQIIDANVEARNYVLSQELIFSLNMNNITEVAFGSTGFTSWFTMTGTGGFNRSITNWNTVYENTKYGSSDYRYAYLRRDLSASVVTSNKLYQATTTYGSFINRMPLMRLSEAYFIAAEASLNLGDKTAALDYMNTVREHRNIFDPFPGNLTDSEVQEEIRKEYVKDLICEGQLFFYYKRLNSETIQFYSPWGANPLARSVYVLPLPDDELEYGQRYIELE
ncbi:MAG: RagB/SusD family nutrient uptake outer membrane protein [Odoribacteraceae bacterium]|jgi:hypothetical protein|nr:RagB/SusD family nutrient uptake outer membrane protein [Odoribacteraceae bacterium]